MNEIVLFDSFGKIGQLLGCWQLAEQNQKGDFQERTFFCQHFDRVASVLKNPLISINVANFGSAGNGVHISRVIGSQDQSFVRDFLEIGGFDETVSDGDFVGLSRSCIVNGEGLFALDLFSYEGKSIHIYAKYYYRSNEKMMSY